MRYNLLILLIFICLSLSAQQPAKLIQNAKGEISREYYQKAADILEQVISRNPRNKEAVKLYGFCFLNIAGEEEKAWRYLEMAAVLYPITSKRPSSATLETHLYLAKSLHQNNRFEQSLEIYEKLLTLTKPTKRRILNDIHLGMRQNKNALELVKNPRDFKIYLLDEAINSEYEEHSPIVALDESTIYFTSNRPVEGRVNNEGRYFENIYVSYWRDGKWLEAELLELPGRYLGNRATVSLSADGNTLVFYQNDGYTGSLFMTQRSFRGWSKPVPLPINSTNANETHASFSADGRQIWFSSDRPGGFGGKDIYVSHLLSDGTWGASINAGPNINTDMDEESPFLSPDGNTLYFSSEGHNSMGGYDIFVSKKRVENNEWTQAENVGYPINTPNDDVFYMPTPDGMIVYYSSRRMGGIGETDLYIIAFPDDDSRALSVVGGYVFNPDKITPNNNATIRITDENSQFHGIYRPNSLTGKFVAILPTGMSYKLEVEAEGYMPQNLNIAVPLRDIYGVRQRATYIQNINLESAD